MRFCKWILNRRFKIKVSNSKGDTSICSISFEEKKKVLKILCDFVRIYVRAMIIKNLKSMVPERYKWLLRPVYSEIRSIYHQLKKDNLIARFHKKKNGVAKYSIVSACYNVENYIDEFIKSIVNQSLVFENNIQLILVDDGSTDSTHEKIQAWVRKYPHNIEYYYKENGGQASARNLGLQYVKHEWVNFADPDDMLGLTAFENVDNFLADVSFPCCMVCFNLLPYFEKQRVIRDNHPLNYKFKNEQNVRKISELGDFIQLSASTALIRSDVVRREALKFNLFCRPNFEDANFINTYLTYCSRDESVVFLKKSKYIYRKRSIKNSTLDTSWSTKKNFSDVFVHGKLPLLALWKARGDVPTFIQNVVLYDCYWHISYLVNRPDRLSILNDEEKTNYLDLLEKVYSYCDRSVIESFSRMGMARFYYKVGILGCFKHMKPSFQIAYIEDWDSKNNEIRVRYYTYDIGQESFLINGRKITPRFAKSVEDYIGNRVFVRQRVFWVSLGDAYDDAYFTVQVDGVTARLSMGRQSNSFTLGAIKAYFASRKINETSPYAHAWLISDRDIQADDNGEHFYRYLMKTHPEVNAYFLLNSDSHDWERLKKEGFRLIAYGSREHKEAWANSDHVISSHADGYVINYFNDKYPDPKGKHLFTFLQHGVTQNNLSLWLNSKEIHCFVTTTHSEYCSLAGDHTPYKNLTPKEVVLTGFPRHDALLLGNNPQKVIIVMPTWRKSLIGVSLPHTAKHDKNPEFMQTQYAKLWEGLLNNERLKSLVEKQGYRVLFFPHANIQPYLKYFSLPKYVEVTSHADYHIQDLFKMGAVLITDYSSVAFDFAYLKKPVIYYQFDEKDVFEGHSHTVQKGYFDYRRDGFGPVVSTEEEVLEVLEALVKKDCNMPTPYKNRVEATFVYRDGKCCERVYGAISKLI